MHHVMTYIDARGDSLKRAGKDGRPGYSSRGTGPGFQPLGDLSGWGPGARPEPLDKDLGYYLPRGAKIVMEVHYHKNGRVEKDRTRMGLHFANAPIKKRLRSHVVLDFMFQIPPGAKHHRVGASWTVKEDIHAISVAPHMHLLGREMTVSARRPDEAPLTLLRLEDWDFNWQQAYVFAKPVALPAGTRVEVEGWFDNSAENPNNPRKEPVAVHFGEQTTDEMCVAYFSYTRDADDGSDKSGNGIFDDK